MAKVASNIITCRIEPTVFWALVKKFHQQTSFKTTHRIVTRYKYEDLLMEIDSAGKQKCYISKIVSVTPETDQLCKVSINQQDIPVFDFKPSKQYHWSRQLILLEFSQGEITVQFECLLPDKLAKRDLATTMWQAEHESLGISHSYRIYARDASDVVPLMTLDPTTHPRNHLRTERKEIHEIQTNIGTQKSKP